MSNVYMPPHVFSGNDIPAGVLNYLNGEDLASKTQALRFSTVDADGWPKAALLSAATSLVIVDNEINLFHLMPLFRINRGDGGFFLDKACVISRDPDDWDNDNVENVGVYLLQVKGRRKLSIQPIPQHDIAIHLTHAAAR